MANGAFVRSKDREREWARLMREGNAGNAASYHELLRQITPVLRGLARNGLRRAGASETDAEDIVQDTLLAMHLKRRTWDETAPLGPWISAITRHKIIDALRRRGRRVDVPIDDFAESLHDGEPEPTLILADVSRHLDALPEGQRNVLKLIALDGGSIDDAAARLSMSKGAVRVALHRGLTRLAARFRMDE